MLQRTHPTAFVFLVATLPLSAAHADDGGTVADAGCAYECAVECQHSGTCTSDNDCCPSNYCNLVRGPNDGFCDFAHDCFHGAHLDSSGRTVCNNELGCACGSATWPWPMALLSAYALLFSRRRRS
jgi:uncharacterized protein (TIGR03382 family)